jgi:VWFA-related protein
MVRPGSRATALAQNATLSGRSYLLVLDGGPMTANDWMACDSLDDARRFVKDYLQPGDLAAVWEGDPGQVNFTTDPAVLLRNLTPSVGVSVRTELSGSKSGLDAAIGFLSSIQGTRKSLVFFSCGWIPWAFDMLAPNQPDLDLRARYFEANEGFQLASRSDVLIYACDARGLLTGAAAADQRGSAPRVDILASNGALKTLAEATGGFALVNGNDYGPGFAHIVEDNSHYYVLGYDSPIRGQDGRFINVNVRVDHSGLTVRARQGYFAK